jgi:hypothetical protein
MPLSVNRSSDFILERHWFLLLLIRSHELLPQISSLETRIVTYRVHKSRCNVLECTLGCMKPLSEEHSHNEHFSTDIGMIPGDTGVIPS